MKVVCPVCKSKQLDIPDEFKTTPTGTWYHYTCRKCYHQWNKKSRKCKVVMVS